MSPRPSVRRDHWVSVATPLLATTATVSAASPVSASRSLKPPVGVTPRMSTTPVVRTLSTIATGPGALGTSRTPVPPTKANRFGSSGESTLSYPVTKTMPPAETYASSAVMVEASWRAPEPAPVALQKTA